MFRKFAVSVMVFVFLFVSNAGYFVSTVSAESPVPSASPTPNPTSPPPPPATTVNPWYKQSFGEWLIKVSDSNNPTEIFGERYTAAQVQWVVYGLVYMVLDMTGHAELVACLMRYKNESDWVLHCGPMIVEATTGLITSTETNTYLARDMFRPLATAEYLKSVKERLSLVSEANAQGFGFNAANPILELWKASRDMAYVLMVLVIIAMAFMIMFRVKLSPQTIITVQSALPRVVITLILITFSYAIGGLMIDLMYVIIGLVAALIQGSHLSNNDWAKNFSLLTDMSVISHLFIYFLGFLMSFVVNLIASIWAIILVGAAAVFLWPVLLIGIVLFLIFFLWKSIKILFALIKAYINIILSIAFAPFILLGGALGVGGFSKWIKGLLANIIIFPTVGIMLFVAFMFLRASYPQWMQNLFVNAHFGIDSAPDINTSWDPPLIFGTQESASRLLYLMTSFSIVMLIPKAADIIKATMEKRSFGYGTAIGAESALITSPAMSVAKQGGTAVGGYAGVGVGSGLSRAGQFINDRSGGQAGDAWGRLRNSRIGRRF